MRGREPGFGGCRIEAAGTGRIGVQANLQHASELEGGVGVALACRLFEQASAGGRVASDSAEIERRVEIEARESGPNVGVAGGERGLEVACGPHRIGRDEIAREVELAQELARVGRALGLGRFEVGDQRARVDRWRVGQPGQPGEAEDGIDVTRGRCLGVERGGPGRIGGDPGAGLVQPAQRGRGLGDATASGFGIECGGAGWIGRAEAASGVERGEAEGCPGIAAGGGCLVELEGAGRVWGDGPGGRGIEWQEQIGERPLRRHDAAGNRGLE